MELVSHLIIFPPILSFSFSIVSEIPYPTNTQRSKVVLICEENMPKIQNLFKWLNSNYNDIYFQYSHLYLVGGVF